MNNGTYAATTLGDAMSCQSSGSHAEARTPLRDVVLGALSDATARDSDETADSVLAQAGQEGETK